MTNQIDDYAKRPIRYKNIDGLSGLAIGFLWVLAPLLEIFTKTAPSGSIWHGKTPFLVCIATLACVVFYAPKALKKRLTYRRTEYVKYRQSRVRVIAGLLAGIAATIATVLIVRGFEHHSFEIGGIALASTAWGVFYVFLTRLDAAWRWVVLVALIAAPPIVATFPLSHLWLDTFVVEGLIFIVSGVIALTLYLRRNPVPEKAGE